MNIFCDNIKEKLLLLTTFGAFDYRSAFTLLDLFELMQFCRNPLSLLAFAEVTLLAVWYNVAALNAVVIGIPGESSVAQSAFAGVSRP
jgi:hypothetical protein